MINPTEFNYDLEHGFAWIMLEAKDGGVKHITQCCLEKDECGKFVKRINKSDCGHSWGLCGDANEAAFNSWGESACMELLFQEASESGFVVE